MCSWSTWARPATVKARLGAFEVDRQIAAEHAAAQLKADKRVDIALGDTQVDIFGGDFERLPPRVPSPLAVSLPCLPTPVSRLRVKGERLRLSKFSASR